MQCDSGCGCSSSVFHPLISDLDRLETGELFSSRPSLISFFALEPTRSEEGEEKEEKQEVGGMGGGSQTVRLAACGSCRCSEGRRPH